MYISTSEIILHTTDDGIRTYQNKPGTYLVVSDFYRNEDLTIELDFLDKDLPSVLERLECLLDLSEKLNRGKRELMESLVVLSQDPNQNWSSDEEEKFQNIYTAISTLGR